MDYKVRFFDYPLQFKSREQEYLEVIRATLSKGSYILGKELEKFEQDFARFIGARYSIGVGNCTDGLLLSLYALGISQGDEVITVSHTFVATIEVIVALGAKPIFVDIAEDHNMDVEQVEDAITLLKQKNLRENVIIEVSGGIHPENIVDYLLSNPDIRSSGQLTQFPSEEVDFSLRFD